jgi:hypothetical protein
MAPFHGISFRRKNGSLNILLSTQNGGRSYPPTRLHGVTNQKTAILTITTVKTSERISVPRVGLERFGLLKIAALEVGTLDIFLCSSHTFSLLPVGKRCHVYLNFVSYYWKPMLLYLAWASTRVEISMISATLSPGCFPFFT